MLLLLLLWWWLPHHRVNNTDLDQTRKEYPWEVRGGENETKPAPADGARYWIEMRFDERL